ncbi:MAG: IS5 family transposase, partial [bacterium]
FRIFLRLDIDKKPPDDTTLVRFRNRLEENGVYDKLMDKFEKQLIDSELRINEGRITIVDATLVVAHTRPKSGDPSHLEKHDPGAEITCRRDKGPICGYKLHAAMDAETRMIRRVELTGAKQMEVNHLLIPPGTVELMADKGYHSAKNRRKLRQLGVCDRIMYRGARAHPLTEEQKAFNRPISVERSAIESKFGEMKRWHRLRRAIYRGLDRVKRQVVLTVLAVNMKRLTTIMAQSTG